MKLRRASLPPLLLAALLVAAACSAPPMPTQLLQAPRCSVTLGAEDVVTIRVVGEAELSGDYQSDTTGQLAFPYVGNVDIRGKTNTSLANYITKSLIDGDYILDPQVTVVIKQHNSARINVDGEVTRPGSLPFRTGMTLLEAISKAGGRTQIASRRFLRLTRNTGEEPVTEDVPVQEIYEGRQDDIRLCPGDAIYVPQSIM